MLIELNGLNFHLRIEAAGPTGSAQASIVDEAFEYGVMKRPVFGTECVCSLITDYTGFKPTPSIIARISGKLPDELSQAA